MDIIYPIRVRDVGVPYMGSSIQYRWEHGQIVISVYNGVTMKKRDLKKLREASPEELYKFHAELSQEISAFDAGRCGMTAHLEGTVSGGIKWGFAKRLKRDRARVLTIMRERGIKLPHK